jgi:hypothetical protein
MILKYQGQLFSEICAVQFYGDRASGTGDKVPECGDRAPCRLIAHVWGSIVDLQINYL